MTNNRPTDKKKKYLEEHFFYEVEMFLYTSKTLHERSFEEDPLLKNVLLESFTNHARCLIEFFYPKHSKRDDAIASHFINHWDNYKNSISPSLSELKTRVGKEIAHLTYKRIAGYQPEKAWNIIHLRNDLLVIVKLFLDSLDPILLGKSLDFLKNKMR